MSHPWMNDVQLKHYSKDNLSCNFSIISINSTNNYMKFYSLKFFPPFYLEFAVHVH